MKSDKISDLTTNRLSIYLRCLSDLSKCGQKTVSSAELAAKFHLNSAQIRKDLASFGEFGQPGIGYHVETLRDHLVRILGLDQERHVCIIGSGRLGTALADYYAAQNTNFKIRALFDVDKRKIGKKIGGLRILDGKNFSSVVKKDNIEVAIIAVPAEFAQGVFEQIVKSGIKAVMNFAPVPLKGADGVKLKTVDLTTSLEGLSYHIAGQANGKSKGVKPISNKRRIKK